MNYSFLKKINIFYLLINDLKHKDNSTNGFTIVEISVVIAILGVLTGITFPSITKWVKLSKIDAAKASLNSALIECLQGVRDGKLPEEITLDDSIISDDSLENYGFKVKDGSKKCTSIYLSPKKEDKVLFEFGFEITNAGKVTKFATPASDNSSLGACKLWGGVNCGASAEQLEKWRIEKELAAAKSSCNNNFFEWLNNTPPNGGTGSFDRWDENTSSCTKKAFAFEGTIMSSEQAVAIAREAKQGAECNAAVLAVDNNFTSPQSGTSLDKCEGQTFYFCQGEDKQTIENMNACIALNEEAKCRSERENVRINGPWGKYGPKEGPGTCGETFWMCKGQQLTNKTEYESSDCFSIPPPPPPPPSQCPFNPPPNSGLIEILCISPGTQKDHIFCKCI